MKILEMTIFTQGLLTKIFDLIFPPTKSELLLRETSVKDIKNLYQPNLHQGIYYLANYSEPLIQTAITANKFEHNPLAPKLLSILLDTWVSQQNKNLIFIPIPLSRERYKKRGHNQVETILKASVENLKIQTNLLRRALDTKPQTQLSKKERERNLTKAFIYTNEIKKLPANTKIILFDDVVTTGTTLREAKKALVEKVPDDIEVICLAIAH